jgi:hypothetical protein
MAEILKKVVVKNKNLPYVSFDDTMLFYPVRYRIVSEDKNRVSQWSPTYKLEVPPTSDAGLPYDGAVNSTRFHIDTTGSNPTVINAIWSFKTTAENPSSLEKVFADVNVFDIWVRWNPNNSPSNTGWTEWEHISTVSTRAFSTIKRTVGDPKQVQIAVQIPTNTKVRDDRLTLFIGKSNV